MHTSMRWSTRSQLRPCAHPLGSIAHHTPAAALNAVSSCCYYSWFNKHKKNPGCLLERGRTSAYPCPLWIQRWCRTIVGISSLYDQSAECSKVRPLRRCRLATQEDLIGCWSVENNIETNLMEPGPLVAFKCNLCRNSNLSKWQLNFGERV